MNVFDFDGTIYDGDSSVDFWLFCLCRRPALARYLPRQLSGAFLYVAGKSSKEEFKARCFSFLGGLPDVDMYVGQFWDRRQAGIRQWYRDIQKEDDCVISASPAFLLSEICSRLGIKNLIATEVDKRTGRLAGRNCHGRNKPDFYRGRFGDATIDGFYSDSRSDGPMARLADEAFIVKKDTIIKWGVAHDL